MRTIRFTLYVVTITIAIVSGPLMAQERKPPKKGDMIIVRGCLRGSAVESADMMRVDAEGQKTAEDVVPALTYRLQGKKDLLKDLKDKHDKKVVEVKGILRSELSGSGLGKTVGNTRISIGVDPRTGSGPHGNDTAVPVLEAQSFEGTTISCAR